MTGFRRVCARGRRQLHPFITFLQELWMRVSTVARVVRIPVLAAAVVAPMFVAACSNDPLAPNAGASRISASASGGSQPWYSQASTTQAGTTQTSTTASGGSQPWYKGQTGTSSTAPTPQATGGSQPWY
ncbi:hypothetical protein tb265_14710 [Gemmatimonadetes bacterium T265]|nr:hypothetical protein tb265_14710 [Gemmatimonadetes bacterium T265]